jgi:hypothetical protein
MAGTGTRQDPWELGTANGGSVHRMWRDETADPPALIRRVGSTLLRNHLRAIEDPAARGARARGAGAQPEEQPGPGRARVPGRPHEGRRAHPAHHPRGQGILSG